MSRGKRQRRKKMGVMDRILILVAVVLLLYTVVSMIIFVKTGLEASTLTTCIFAACTGELGVMGWIKSNKDRQQERKWEQEDRKKEETLNEQNDR